jgi:hypothetical protein
MSIQQNSQSGMKDTKLEKMGRRRFIEVASALGISGTALRLGTQEGLAAATNDPSEEVPYVRKMKVLRDDDGYPKGREPVYGSISRDRWIDIETTNKAQRKITEQLQREFPGSPSVHASVTGMAQSPTGRGILVQYYIQQNVDGSVESPSASREEIRSKLPDKVTASVARDGWKAERTGIPVLVTEEVDKKPRSYKHNWEDPPAGCVVSGGTANGSYWYDGNYHLITAGHVVGDINKDWGNPTDSENDGYVVDKVNDRGSNRDYALLAAYQNNIQAALRNDSDANPQTDLRIASTVTDQEIDYEFCNTEKPMSYQGKETGRVETYVRSFSTNDKSSNTDQTLQVEQDVINGDSGGIFFHKDPDYDQIDVMGVIYDTSYYGTIGNTAESVENYFGGYYA